MRPLEFGWYLPTHGDTTAYGVPEAQMPGSPELCERVVQAAEAAGFEYLLIPVGSVCWEAWITGRVHGGAVVEDQAADRGAAGLHQSGAAGQDDLDLRPDVGRAHLHQPDRRPERKRSRGRGRALRQGRALRADGGGGLDPQGAVDHARPGAFRGQISHAVGRAYPAAPAAAAISEILSRRRLAAGLGNVGQAFRRASVLGRSAGAHRRQYRRDQGDGAGAWPRTTTSASACGCR